MAVQSGRPVTKSAPGDAPNTGAPGPTPPPSRPAPPDEVTELRHPANLRSGYGLNGYSGPSSIPPGQQKLSPLAENLKASSEAPDGLTLDHIIQHGTARDTSVDLQSTQTRKIDATPSKSSFGLTRRGIDSGSPGGTVPARTGAIAADDRYTQGVKRADK